MPPSILITPDSQEAISTKRNKQTPEVDFPLPVLPTIPDQQSKAKYQFNFD